MALGKSSRSMQNDKTYTYFVRKELSDAATLTDTVTEIWKGAIRPPIFCRRSQQLAVLK